jgi:hypothetical protein
MISVQDTSQELYNHFLKGGFSVQLDESNHFGRLPKDQIIEENVNRDKHTSGGTKGSSFDDMKSRNRIKTWKRLLGNVENKNRLKGSLVENWKEKVINTLVQ